MLGAIKSRLLICVKKTLFIKNVTASRIGMREQEDGDDNQCFAMTYGRTTPAPQRGDQVDSLSAGR